MKFSTVFTFATSFFAAQTLAAPHQKREDAAGAGTKFSLLSIRSGSPVHLLGIKEVESHPFVFSVGGDEGDYLEVTLQKDGSLKDNNGKIVYNKPDTGEIGIAAQDGQVTKGFYLKDRELRNNDFGFYACPSGENKYSLTSSSWDGCYGIALLYNEINDN